MIDYYISVAKQRGQELIAEAEAERIAAQIRHQRRARR